MKHIKEKTLLLALKAARIQLELMPRRDQKTGEKYWSYSVWFRATGGSSHGGEATKKDALYRLHSILRRRINENRYDEAERELRRDLEDRLRVRLDDKLARLFPRGR